MSAETVPLADLGPLGEEIGAGGQGRVIRIRRRPGLLVKVYAADVDRDALLELVRWRRALPTRDRRIVDSATAWPLAVVDGPDQVGVLVREAPPVFFQEIAGHRQVRDLQWAYCRSVSYVGREPVSRRAAVTLVHHWATVLDILHRHGVVYGDLSATNVLWSERGARPGLFVIDCDSAWVTTGARAVAGGQTPGWDDPWPSDGSPDAERRRDLYKLGLMFLRLYYRSQLPIDALTRQIALPADPPTSRPIRDLLVASLRRDGSRPGAADWVEPLRCFERVLRSRGVA